MVEGPPAAVLMAPKAGMRAKPPLWPAIPPDTSCEKRASSHPSAMFPVAGMGEEEMPGPPPFPAPEWRVPLGAPDALPPPPPEVPPAAGPRIALAAGLMLLEMCWMSAVASCAQSEN